MDRSPEPLRSERSCLTYIYEVRRMNSFFVRSQHWQNYDPFGRQKISTFRSSRPAVLELAAKYQELVTQLRQRKAEPSKSSEELEAEKLLFIEMCEICLWGNATDLSLLTSLTYEDIQKLQGSEARKSSEKNILINDLPAAFQVLNKARESSGKNVMRQVDIILDNAGFELFVDLVLAGYLLSAGLATHVVLHPKSIPWFVSDVLPADFGALLNALADPQRFYSTPSDEDQAAGRSITPLSENEVSNLFYLFQNLSRFHQEGQLILRPNLFWTSAGSYWNLPDMAPDLYEELYKSELVIFKGDLNYRKLTRDVCSILFPFLSDPLLILSFCFPPSSLSFVHSFILPSPESFPKKKICQKQTNSKEKTRTSSLIKNLPSFNHNRQAGLPQHHSQPLSAPWAHQAPAFVLWPFVHAKQMSSLVFQRVKTKNS